MNILQIINKSMSFTKVVRIKHPIVIEPNIHLIRILIILKKTYKKKSANGSPHPLTDTFLHSKNCKNTFKFLLLCQERFSLKSR